MSMNEATRRPLSELLTVVQPLLRAAERAGFRPTRIADADGGLSVTLVDAEENGMDTATDGERVEPFASLDPAARADRFPAILALACFKCGASGPRSRMSFVNGTGRGSGFGRFPVCPACVRKTNGKWSLSAAVAERRAA